MSIAPSGFLLANELYESGKLNNINIANSDLSFDEKNTRQYIYEVAIINLNQGNAAIALELFYHLLLQHLDYHKLQNAVPTALRQITDRICDLSLSGDYGTASNTLKKVIALDPSGRFYPYLLGPSLEDSGKLISLIRLLSAMATSGSNRAIRQLMESVSYKAVVLAFNIQSDIAQTSTLCREIIEFNPNSDDAYHLMGVLMRRQGDFKKAVEFIKIAIALCPSHNQAYYSLSLCHSSLQDNRMSAQVAYRQLILKQKEKIFLFHIMSMIDGKYLSAKSIRSHIKEMIINVILSDPLDIEYIKLMMSFFIKEFDYHSASQIAMKGLSISPSEMWIMEILGQVLIKQGLFEDSLTALERTKVLGGISYSSQAFIVDSQRALNKPYRALGAAWTLACHTFSEHHSNSSRKIEDIDAILDEIDKAIPPGVDKEDSLLYIMEIGTIGHLAAEPSMIASMFRNMKNIIILYSEKSRTSATNSEVLRIISQHVTFIKTDNEKILGLACLEIGRFWRGTTLYMLHSWRYVFRNFFYFIRSGGKRINTFLLPDQVERGERIRKEIGIPQDAKIATLHLRYSDDGGARNTTLELYFDAINYLVKEGYFVIRIGDKKMKPLSHFGKQVIDCPFMENYDQIMDPYFIHESKFMIASLSGAVEIGRLFKKSTIMPNIPICGTVVGDTVDYIGFRRYVDHSTGIPKNLKFREILELDEEMNLEQRLRVENIEMKEMSSTEIMEIVKEFIKYDRLSEVRMMSDNQKKFTSVCNDINLKRNEKDVLVKNYADWCGYASGLVKISDVSANFAPDIFEI